MKKFALLMALSLALLTFVPVFAELEWADPALCIDGKWLVIDSANPPAIEVIVGKGSRYGGQHAGGCTTPAPAPLLPLNRVKERGEHDDVRVRIDGQGASPVVTVTYGLQSRTEHNHGGVMQFRFR